MRSEALPPPEASNSDASKLDAACAKAMELQLAGQLDLARQLYSAILQAAPQHSAANYGLGMLHVQSQRAADGLPHLKAALQTQLDIPDYWLGYLEALTLAGRTDAARNILALGRQHGLKGEAVEDFAKRLDAKLTPQPPAAIPAPAANPVEISKSMNSAGPVAAAKSNKRRPSSPKNRRKEAIVVRNQEAALLLLVEQHNNAAALTLARAMTERFPERGLGWKILGAFMSTENNVEEGIAVMLTAVRLMPQDAEAHVNLGITLARAKRFKEAESNLHKALELDPGSSAAHFRLAVCYELQGRYGEAEASLRRGRALGQRAMSIAGDDQLSYSHMLFFMGHNPAVDADEFFAEHRRYGEYFEGPLRSSWPLHPNSRDPERRLNLGIVSGDLYNHSVAKFLEPILRRLASCHGFELHAYYSHTVHDETSSRLRACVKGWNLVSEFSDTQLAAKIMDDRIDVLLDLSGHSGLNRLPVFARKPAPIQVSWLGYPGTTGLQAMDYYLADPQWLPPGQFDRLFTEKLVYLPDRWAFELHPDTPVVGPLPALATGRLTFGSFHRLGKINPATVDLWAALLRALPHAGLLLVGIPLDGQQNTLLESFAARGIAADRLTLHDRVPLKRYLALHNEVDIALDTQPYGGATTTMHSLSMGVPTLTVAGTTSMARACAGILGHVGLAGFVAHDAADFIAKACYWADHLAMLAGLRAELRIRQRQSPGGQPDLIAAHIEAAVRHMWRRWCAGLPAEPFHSSVPDKPA